MGPGEYEQMLHDAEVRLARLKALYEQYFQGIEKIEPAVARKELERLLEIMRKSQPRNTALRFRTQMLLAKYGTYTTYWQRITRQIEEGTYRRDLAKVKQRRAREQARRSGEEREGPTAWEIDVDVDQVEDLASFSFDDSDVDAILGALGPASVPPPSAPSPSAPPSRRLSVFGSTLARPSAAPEATTPAGAQPIVQRTAAQEPAARQSAAPGEASAPPSATAPRVVATFGKPGATAVFGKPAAKPGPTPTSGAASGAGASSGSGAPVERSPGPAAPPGARPLAAPPAARPAAPAGAVPAPSGPRPPVPPPPGARPPVPGAPGARPAVPAPGARPAIPAPGARPAVPVPPPGARPPMPGPGAPGSLPKPAVGTPPARPAAPPVAASARPLAGPSQPGGPARPAPPRPASGAGIDDTEMRRIYDRYVEARRRNNERVDNVRYETLAQSVHQMIPKLREKHGDRKIDFDVVVQNGKVGLKPKVV